MRLVLSLLLATAATSTARADQCALVDSKIATKALDLARKSTKVLDFCEPCGDKTPRGPYRINSADIKNRQVVINGKSVDLAYVYLHTSGDVYSNLGLDAGCQAEGVSASLKDSRPVIAPPPPLSPTPPRPIPLPPPGPPPNWKRVTTPDDIGGTWTVTVRASVSTCSAVSTTMPPAPVPGVTWTITSTSGDVSIMTDDGYELSATGATLGRFNMLDLQLDAKRSKRAMRLHQFSKDSFDGKLVVIEQKSRQTCATAFDVYGRRVP